MNTLSSDGSIKARLKSFFDFSVFHIDDNGVKLTFLALFIPKLCEILFSRVASTVNTLLISGYAENAVGATTSATQILSIFTILLNVTTVGATILISLELGRGDKERAGTITATSLLLLIITSGLASIGLFLFAKPLLIMLNLEGEALVYGTEYLKIRGGLLFVSIINGFLGTALVCNGKAVHTMISGMTSSLLNILFIYLLLYVKIIPNLSGTSAIAVATEAACFCSLTYSAIVFCCSRCPFVARFDKFFFTKIYKLGIPGSLSSFSYTMAITLTVGFIGAIGITSLNAYSYTNNIIAYSCTISAVISPCLSVFVGRYAGRGDIEAIKKICRLTLFIASMANTLIAIGIFIFKNPLLSMFTTNEQIFSMCTVILAVDCIIEFGRGIVHVLETAMNASGNVIITMVMGLLTAWGCIVLLTYVLGIVLGLGLLGCWIAFATSELTKATVYVIHFRKNKWVRSIF